MKNTTFGRAFGGLLGPCPWLCGGVFVASYVAKQAFPEKTQNAWCLLQVAISTPAAKEITLFVVHLEALVGHFGSILAPFQGSPFNGRGVGMCTFGVPTEGHFVSFPGCIFDGRRGGRGVFGWSVLGSRKVRREASKWRFRSAGARKSAGCACSFLMHSVSKVDISYVKNAHIGAFGMPPSACLGE